MDEQRKLRNLLSYTKTDSVEGLEEVNRLYEKLLSYINKSKKENELLGLYREKSDFLVHIMNGNKGLQENYMKLLENIDKLEKELGGMK